MLQARRSKARVEVIESRLQHDLSISRGISGLPIDRFRNILLAERLLFEEFWNLSERLLYLVLDWRSGPSNSQEAKAGERPTALISGCGRAAVCSSDYSGGSMHPAVEPDLAGAARRHVWLALLEPSRLFVLHALFLACIFDPAGSVLGAKYFLFLLWMLLSIAATGAGLQPMPGWMLVAYVGFFALILPAYGLLVGLARGGLDGEFVDTSYITGGAFFTFALFLTQRRWLASAMSALLLALRLLTIAIVGFALLDLVGLVGDLPAWLDENRIAVVASRNYGGVDFRYIYFVRRRCSCFFWRLTRGHRRPISMATAGRGLPDGLGAVPFRHSSEHGDVARRSGGRPLMEEAGRPEIRAGGLRRRALRRASALPDGNGRHWRHAERGRTQNAVKLGYLPHYLRVLDDPLTLLFGQGFNAHVWSADVREMLPEGSSITELTYLDLLRVFGLVGAVPTLALLAYLRLSRRSYRSAHPFVGAAVFLYALLAVGNPYLFSSNGMTLIGVVAAVVAAADGRRRIKR